MRAAGPTLTLTVVARDARLAGALGLVACLAAAGATWRGQTVAPRPALAR